MSKQISLFWAKLQLKIVKLLPMIIAFIYILGTVLNYYEVNTIMLNLLGGMSFLPLVFLYVASFAFRFCGYHRMFLHYIAASDCINWLDYVINIPITDLQYLILLVALYGITCFIALFMFLRKRGRLQK